MPFDAALQEDLSAVRGARTLFLHHSVGADVLGGLRKLDHEQPAGERLRIVPLAQAVFLEGPALMHGSAGTNAQPHTKIDAFVDLFARRPWLRPQLALMKLCYVDVDPDTDVDSLFAHYRRALASLAAARPETRFGHVTLPLTRSPADATSFVRRAFGFDVWEDAANERRCAYNRLLRRAMAGQPIFDLAAAEVGPDRSSLNPRFTDDGGHLNDVGARVAAVAFVRFVAGALR